MAKPATDLRIQVENIGDVAVVHFLDKKILDALCIQGIADELYRLVDLLGRKKILLNFQNVDFLSSALLGTLVYLNHKLQKVQGKLVLCCIAPKLIEVFQITKIDQIIPMVKDEQAGLLAF